MKNVLNLDSHSVCLNRKDSARIPAGVRWHFATEFASITVDLFKIHRHLENAFFFHFEVHLGVHPCSAKTGGKFKSKLFALAQITYLKKGIRFEKLFLDLVKANMQIRIWNVQHLMSAKWNFFNRNRTQFRETPPCMGFLIKISMIFQSNFIGFFYINDCFGAWKSLLQLNVIQILQKQVKKAVCFSFNLSHGHLHNMVFHPFALDLFTRIAKVLNNSDNTYSLLACAPWTTLEPLALSRHFPMWGKCVCRRVLSGYKIWFWIFNWLESVYKCFLCLSEKRERERKRGKEREKRRTRDPFLCTLFIWLPLQANVFYVHVRH